MIALKIAYLKRVITFDSTANHDAKLAQAALDKFVQFNSVKPGHDDIVFIGFTSGINAEPKATMHFHRDLLIVANSYAKEILNVQPKHIFVGSPPLALTFGLGELAISPLRFGATAPSNIIKLIETYQATISFTTPTAYHVMIRAMNEEG